jgi:hypothetical protein
MPINKGDRVAHSHGFLGTVLTAETNGLIQVQHDSGGISTWIARDTTVIRRAAPSPAPSTSATADRPSEKKRAPRKRPKATSKKVKPKARKRKSEAKKSPRGPGDSQGVAGF